MKYIDTEKLIAELRRQKHELELSIQSQGDYGQSCHIIAYENIISLISSLQQEQLNNMIQWTGNNLKEVIDFTGKSSRFEEWFKSWEDFENYVHSHGDIFKLFCEDGSHYEVPVGAWIVKTPDGYNVPSVAKYIQQEQPDIGKIKREWYNKGYLKGREESNIPARELGLPKSCDIQEQPEVDLKKELHQWRHKHFKGKRDGDYSGEYLERESQLDLSRHFYELGLNARKT